MVARCRQAKSYPRSAKIILPVPEKPKGELTASLLNRKSARNFSGGAITIQNISNLLFWSAGLTQGEELKRVFRRPYPCFAIPNFLHVII